ncbi:uncharacterized protein VP01_4327g1 [Puccinia sorghi]|uniref:Uncharacterized protein n=1 Tax=Puccinia sorghi TaxID=27349 RepID=A0A0L6UQ12_9BASI|nr:uncharacterized protein VP01_4327g1 [Puccinia sorghi]
MHGFSAAPITIVVLCYSGSCVDMIRFCPTRNFQVISIFPSLCHLTWLVDCGQSNGHDMECPPPYSAGSSDERSNRKVNNLSQHLNSGNVHLFTFKSHLFCYSTVSKRKKGFRLNPFLDLMKEKSNNFRAAKGEKGERGMISAGLEVAMGLKV